MTNPNYLAHYLDRLGWSPERLAQKLNELRGAGTISSKAPYAWLRGSFPRSLAEPVAQIISSNLGETVTVAAIWPERGAGEKRAGVVQLAAAVPSWGLQQELTASAHESSRHAGMAAARGVDEASIEQVHDDIARAARAYAHSPALASYTEAKRIWDQACSTLERTGRPGQESDIYLALGEACGLLAMASFDLGHKAAANEQARSALMYARHIGHAPLCAWARGTQALIAYWSGCFDDAVDHVAHALSITPPGTATVRLRAIQARAFSHLRASRQAAESAAAARAELEAAHPADALHDGIGGEFSFDEARLARCLASAYVKLAQPKEAMAEAQAAVDLYAALPAERSWPSVEAEAKIDMAAAHLLHRDAESAAELLVTVFDLAQEFRIEGVKHRLFVVRDLLAHSGIGDRAASRLGMQIEDFVKAASVGPALPPGL